MKNTDFQRNTMQPCLLFTFITFNKLIISSTCIELDYPFLSFSFKTTIAKKMLTFPRDGDDTCRGFTLETGRANT